MPLLVRNKLLKAVLSEFRPRFAPGGRVLWVTQDDDSILVSRSGLRELGVDLPQPCDLPSVVIYAAKQDWIALIDVAELRGSMTLTRCKTLTETFSACRVTLVLITAFRSRRECQDSLGEIPWGTIAWFEDEPDHLVYFNGARLFGPA